MSNLDKLKDVAQYDEECGVSTEIDPDVLLSLIERLEAAEAEFARRDKAAVEPVAWQFYDDGSWHNGSSHNNHRENTEKAGYRVRQLYAVTPPASIPAPDERLYKLANHIAGAKSALPQEWQDWAEEIESDLRRIFAASGES